MDLDAEYPTAEVVGDTECTGPGVWTDGQETHPYIPPFTVYMNTELELQMLRLNQALLPLLPLCDRGQRPSDLL